MSFYSADTVQRILQGFKEKERSDYLAALCTIVGEIGPIGERVVMKLVFATTEQKIKALQLVNRWYQDQENK